MLTTPGRSRRPATSERPGHPGLELPAGLHRRVSGRSGQPDGPPAGIPVTRTRVSVRVCRVLSELSRSTRRMRALASFWAAVFGSDVDEDSSADKAFVEAAGWGQRILRRTRPGIPDRLDGPGGEHFQVCALGAAVGVDLPARPAHPLGTAEQAALQGTRNPPRVSRGAFTGILQEAWFEVTRATLRAPDGIHPGRVLAPAASSPGRHPARTMISRWSPRTPLPGAAARSAAASTSPPAPCSAPATIRSPHQSGAAGMMPNSRGGWPCRCLLPCGASRGHFRRWPMNRLAGISPAVSWRGGGPAPACSSGSNPAPASSRSQTSLLNAPRRCASCTT